MTSIVEQGEITREWLIRCHDNDSHLCVCSIESNDGDVDILTAEGHLISLNPRQLVHFRAALDAATAQAERDLQNRAG